MIISTRRFTQREKAFINLLREVKEVLDKYGIEFWLDSGTLLGAIRDGRFLSWEHDIDLATWYTNLSGNVKGLVAKGLSDKGFEVNLFKDKMDIQDRQRGVWADLHYFRLVDDRAVELRLEPINLLGQIIAYLDEVFSAPCYFEKNFRGKPIKRNITGRILFEFSLKLPFPLRMFLAKIFIAVYETKIGARDISWVIPADYFRDLSTIIFYGMEIRVPAKREEFLAYRFGKDWHIPRRDWDPNRDDGALVSVREKKRRKTT